ncbi:MAG: hypothetical protein AAFZ58_02635 [Pseudomonadota bacterium]
MKIAAAVSLVALVATSAQADVTVEIISEPGDYIGQGQTYSYDDTNADIRFSRNFDNGISVRIQNLPGQPSDWWNLDLAAPGDAEIAPGVYSGATRFPFQDVTVPGLSFTGNGRGCNTSTGSFQVFDVDYDELGEVTSLSVDFEQFCGNSSFPLRGTIVFNTVPPVGGVAVGMPTLSRFVCYNRTTGQKITNRSPEDVIVDCRKAGLNIRPGDDIQVYLRGYAEE